MPSAPLHMRCFAHLPHAPTRDRFGKAAPSLLLCTGARVRTTPKLPRQTSGKEVFVVMVQDAVMMAVEYDSKLADTDDLLNMLEHAKRNNGTCTGSSSTAPGYHGIEPDSGLVLRLADAVTVGTDEPVGADALVLMQVHALCSRALARRHEMRSACHPCASHVRTAS